MGACRTVSVLSIPDAAYIAGLIDGEGTVTLGRKHANENRQLAVTISNTERRLLDYVITTVGAGKITKKKNCAGPSRAQLHLCGLQSPGTLPVATSSPLPENL